MQNIFHVIDSRMVGWTAVQTGPVSADSLPPDQNIGTMPPVYVLRFHRQDGRPGEIAAYLRSPATPQSIGVVLERHPDWHHEEWVRP